MVHVCVCMCVCACVIVCVRNVRELYVLAGMYVCAHVYGVFVSVPTRACARAV